jgi:hypothetical protein
MGVLDQVLYHTDKENFTPILSHILNLLAGDCQDLAIDLLISCCTFKNGVKITDWSVLAASLIDVLSTDSKRRCQLSAILVAKSDPVTSKSTTQKVFEIFKQKGDNQVGIFCQLLGKFNASYFQKWVLNEFVK